MELALIIMIAKILFLIFLGSAICLEIPASELAAEFGEFVSTYGKKYDTLEETVKRFKIFSENYRQIQEHNLKNTDYTLGVNQFADLTMEEIKAKYLSYKRPTSVPCTMKHVKGEVKTEIDWREKGMVPKIKNQGSCGSCWAFSAVGALESAYAIAKGLPLVEYSEQELVDCSRSYGNEGCNGGEMSPSFEYVKDNGLSTSAEYPYEGRDKPCRKKSKALQISGCVNVTANDSNELLEALNLGPVSIAVKANNWSFMYYRSGIITDGCGREKDELDHGIVLVGAGIDTNKNLPYWIVRNSWGTAWGMQGYAYIKRDTTKGSGVCGIAMENSYPRI